MLDAAAGPVHGAGLWRGQHGRHRPRRRCFQGDAVCHFSSKDQLFATIIGEACQQKIALGELLPADATDLRAALMRIRRPLLRFFLEDRALAIHRVVIGESMRFPELGRAFYDNGPAALFRDVRRRGWSSRPRQAGLPCPTRSWRREQFVGMLRTSLFLRASLGLTPPTRRRDRRDRGRGGDDVPEGIRGTLTVGCVRWADWWCSARCVLLYAWMSSSVM